MFKKRGVITKQRVTTTLGIILGACAIAFPLGISEASKSPYLETTGEPVPGFTRAFTANGKIWQALSFVCYSPSWSWPTIPR